MNKLHRANTLFGSHELNYWLPRYDAAQLTAQPKLEDNLRLFNFFRVAYNVTQTRVYYDPDGDISESDMDTMFDMLSHPPADPEYARLFAIDCFNLATNSKSEWFLKDFFDSDTGRLLDISSLPGRIWYVVKQRKTYMNTDLICRALESPSETPSIDLLETRFALRLIVKAFVEAGEETHYGRTVIGKIMDCEDLEALGTLRQDFDSNSNSPIQQSMRAAMLSLNVHCSPSRYFVWASAISFGKSLCLSELMSGGILSWFLTVFAAIQSVYCSLCSFRPILVEVHPASIRGSPSACQQRASKNQSV
jgi:hypothetical protein